jgi:hypothetical protein
MANDISSLFGLDPDVLRYQMLQQQMGRYNQYPNNPQQNLAATLGSIVGGGAVNLAQGRNAFAIDNPLLRKASALQDIYTQTARSVDQEADPAAFYKSLQSNLRAAGYGREALMASQEARKYSNEERKLAAMEKQSKQFKESTKVTTKDLTVTFDADSGKYLVRDPATDKLVPYNPQIHGGIRETYNQFRDVMNQGRGGTVAPDGTGKPPVKTETEKDSIFGLKGTYTPTPLPQDNYFDPMAGAAP